MKKLEQLSEKITTWIGTPISIVIHTVIFAGVFALKFLGLTTDEILLILTTAVSLEAIYLSIFIQMSVNRTSKSIEGVEKDIDTIQENVDDIQEDVEDLESDVKEISEDYIDDEQEEDELINAVKEIEEKIIKLHTEIDKLTKKNHSQK